MSEQLAISELAEDPDKLLELSSSQLEKLVAEVLAAQGWTVNLTSATRDGGYDLLAVSHDPTGLRSTWIVQCKRYRPERSVGVAALRELYGAKTQLGVSNALLVTTSTFTKDARRFSGSRQDVQLVDTNTLRRWLKLYQPPPGATSHLPSRLFQSCFLSHSHKDQDFADYIAVRLKREGVEVWYAPEDMHGGAKLHEEIQRAIRTFDRLLFVLSANSMESEWVKSELRVARKREIQERRRVLFPIALVPFEMVKAWECFDGDSGKDLAVEIREYYIPDFSQWRTSREFEKAFRNLLEGLSQAKGAA